MKREHRLLAFESCPIPGPKVLIVDDDVPSSERLRRAFWLAGLESFICDNYQEAFWTIQFYPSVLLVVANWMLPEGNVGEFLERLRETEPKLATALIIGQAFLPEAWPSLNVKADYCLAKPFDDVVLDRQINKLARLAVFESKDRGQQIESPFSHEQKQN